MSATSASIFIRRCSPFLVYCRVRNRYPSGWKSAVTSTVDLLTVSMQPPKSKSSGMNEISSQCRAPVDTPSRAKTLAGWCGSAAKTRWNCGTVATTIGPDGGCLSRIPLTGLPSR